MTVTCHKCGREIDCEKEKVYERDEAVEQNELYCKECFESIDVEE